MQMVMTSDETQIQIFANWPLLHAKRVTRDNRKNPEYRVVAVLRKLRTDTNRPAGKLYGLTMLKMGSISDLKRPTAPKTDEHNDAKNGILHHCLLVFLFLADQIFYRSHVDRQHFRLRSFASLCSGVPSYFLVKRFRNSCALVHKSSPAQPSIMF